MPASIRLAFTAAVSAVAVLAVAVTVAQQAPQPLWPLVVRLPAARHRSRAPGTGCAAPAAHVRADLPARKHRREVPRRHVGDVAPRDGRAGRRRHDAGHVERELRCAAARRRRGRRAGGGSAQRPTRCGLRAGAVPGTAALRPERPASTPGSGTSRRSTWSGPGTSTPAARPRSPWPCWTRASPTGAACCARTRSPGRDEDGVRFPALGTRGHPVCRGPRSGRLRPLRRPAGLHLGRRAARSTWTATARTWRAPSDS